MKLDRTLLQTDQINNRGQPKWFDSWDQMDRYYTEKSVLATKLLHNKLEPRIGETGVRGGYCAWTFLKANPRASYTGYELTNDVMAIQTRLRDRFPRAKINVFARELSHIADIGSNLDFVHVNGVDNSFDAKYHELTLAANSLSSGGVIVVNDFTYKHRGYTQQATEKFIDVFKHHISNTESTKSLRGELLIFLR